MSGLSPSGARIRGDDFQHVYAAARAIEVLLPDSPILQLGIEDPDPAVGNADDITVYRSDGANEFAQAKSSVDARAPANIEWLTKPSPQGGPSILSHLFTAWKGLRANGEDPRLLLVSNKQIDPNDPVLTMREGTDGTVALRLGAAAPGSKQGQARKQLAKHLQASEDELLSFLERLSFRFGQLEDDQRAQLAFRLAAVGLRSDDHAVALCIGMVRGWVTSGKRLLTADEIQEEINALGIEATTPKATLVVQAIDHRPSDGATVSLDWVDRYDGDEARSRRVPLDAADWNELFRKQLFDAVQTVRSAGLTRVHIRGAMRLPSWFAAGNAFGETAGFDVEAFQTGELWTSLGPVNDNLLDVTMESTGSHGAETAIVISIATDIIEDVRDHVGALPSIGSILHLRPQRGAGPTAIGGPQAARDMAVAVRNEARTLMRTQRPPRVHVFLASPGVFAMLLGHRWDRIADTQLYADLAPGYAPAYLIPN
jgi:hypothetical protein